MVWLVVLALGRMPQPLYEATVAVLRYRMRYTAYLTMLSSAYPKGMFGEEPGSEPEGPASATRPLDLGGGGRGRRGGGWAPGPPGGPRPGDWGEPRGAGRRGTGECGVRP
ncbi:DUF4389 domain-containing protein [Kitasatospora sp. NPDC059817]|uniref:DUF4389 domain-containing protein n=1 Tax=Kitasatospora sp. NPDC059817 TaxID=3346961 RepID=UPI003664EB75